MPRQVFQYQPQIPNHQVLHPYLVKVAETLPNGSCFEWFTWGTPIPDGLRLTVGNAVYTTQVRYAAGNSLDTGKRYACIDEFGDVYLLHINWHVDVVHSLGVYYARQHAEYRGIDLLLWNEEQLGPPLTQYEWEQQLLNGIERQMQALMVTEAELATIAGCAAYYGRTYALGHDTEQVRAGLRVAQERAAELIIHGVQIDTLFDDDPAFAGQAHLLREHLQGLLFYRPGQTKS
jgi:hypothetical protein